MCMVVAGFFPRTRPLPFQPLSSFQDTNASGANSAVHTTKYEISPTHVCVRLISPGRCSRARRRAEELRTEGLRELRKLQQWEQECEARRLESRRAGLSLLITKGAGLRGMDISGLSDPFCVVMWNGKEVGRTAVRFGTRDPDWEGDDNNGGFSSAGAGWFDLPLHVPDTEKWGSEAWPPMHLEVSTPLK